MNEIASKLKLKVETKTLIQALTFANSVVEKRNVAEELSNIKLQATSGYLEIFATDMDLYLKQKIGAEILVEGETTVSTRTFMDIIKKIPDKEITLSLSDNPPKNGGSDQYNTQLEILSKNCTFTLLTLPANKFPAMLDIQDGTALSLACRDLAQIIEHTQFSISTEETRYNLNGIYLHVQNGCLNAASTDGHRLSVSSFELQDCANDFGVILPRKTVDEILKIIKDSHNIISNIQLVLSSNKIKFICNDIILISKLIDGTFPDYQSFIPVENSYKLTINTKMFKESIDRVATITIDKGRAIKLTFTRESLEISASGEAKGVAREVIWSSLEQDSFCEFNYDDTISVGFNPKYLTDVLNVIKSTCTELYFTDASMPVLIKITDKELDNFVIMPMKI